MNIAMGLGGLPTLVPGWALPAGLAGELLLLVAGIIHLPKRGKNAHETLATWTDLIVGIAVAVLGATMLIRALV